MSKQWILRTHDVQLIQSIEREANVSPALAQILALRGVSNALEVDRFLSLKMTGLHEPADLPGVVRATEIILQAIADRKRIVIYGDYDCDGMTATAILVRCLELLEANVHYFIPNRCDDGYGLNTDALKRQMDLGTDLFISVDCGIASVNEVAFVKQAGKQIIVTDHHQYGEQLPDADALIHPSLPGSQYPFTGLCGAGVAFKLAWGLCQRHHGSAKLPPHLRDFLFNAISLAAIGTVADVVPLLGENRIIVHHGLNCLRMFANPGLKHLLKLTKSADKATLESEDLGFALCPRLNAAGRLGQAQLGVELLICKSEERGQQLAEYIDELNKNRETLDRRILKSARQQILDNFDPQTDPAFVLSDQDWHPGVIGIVAGRLAEAYNRPTILIATDPMGKRPAVGSCRSACGVDVYQALVNCNEFLLRSGGHPAAAGLTIEPDRVDAFRAAFCEEVASQIGDADPSDDLWIDAETLLGHLTLTTMDQINRLAPFGECNPRPVLCASAVELAAPPRPIGDGKHLAMSLKQHNCTLRAVAFGKSDWLPELSSENQAFDFAFYPVINQFRGFKSVELQLIDFRPAKVVAQQTVMHAEPRSGDST